MIQKIKLGDGEEYPIRFSFNALVKLEEILGESPFELLADSKKVVSPATIRALMYSGIYGGYLMTGDEFPFTIDSLGNLLEMDRIEEYIVLFTNDLTSSVKKKK